MIFESVIWTLATWAIRSTMLATVAGLLLWSFRVKDASVRLTIWTAVLAGALLIPLLAITAPGISIPLPNFLSTPAATNPVEVFVPNTTAFPIAKPSYAPPPAWPKLIVLVWLAGAVTGLLRIFVGLYLGSRLRRTSGNIEEGVYESPSVTIPITVGMFRPVILLPSDWRQWDEQTLSAVMTHERSHVERRDPVRRLAASVYLAVCWFHPLAWWLFRHLSELAEAVSDDAALATVRNETAYAEILFAFWKRAPRRVLWQGVAMARAGTLTRRMERILDSDRTLSRRLGPAALLALTAVAIPVIYASAAVRPASAFAAQAQAPAPKTTKAEISTPYLKWLNEDVLYLITPAERLAFTSLHSDEERVHFIEQFWRRRDPTPATPENETKEEHYRRIAYANDRFPWTGPGWKTDRGRVYITFGPPREIESHPRGTNSTPPYEEWKYPYIEGVGSNIIWKFVDSAGTGEYRLVPSPDGGPFTPTDLKVSFSANSVSLAAEGRPATLSSPLTISIPLGAGPGPVTVVAEITSADHLVERVFKNMIDGSRGPAYEPKVELPAGSYTLNVVVRRQDGPEQRAEVRFVVE
jgi:GWxTD domain-containing protein